MKSHVKNNVFHDHNKDENSLKNVDYDELLSYAGEIGWYQLFLFASTSPFYVFGAFSYFTQLFMTEVPSNHWCWVPELENMTAIKRRNLAIPQDQNENSGYLHCSSYVANWSAVLESGEKPNESWPIAPCQNGWEFNQTEIPYPTISSEMGWVCEKDNYQATAQSIFFVGSIVGGLCIGWVADRYGRLPAGVIGNMIGCVAGLASVFANNFIEFCICRFFMGMSYDTCMMMIYLLVLEYVAPKYRTIAANLPIGIFFTSGMIMLPSLALACGHWKTFGLVTSAPMALALLAPFIIPESPRWLLSQGRIDEAVDKVTNIGRINNRKIPSDLIQRFKESAPAINSNQDSKTILDIFKSPPLRRILFCICLEFMCCTIVFDALLRSIGSLAFDFFLSFTLLSLTELPSLLIVSFTLDLTGRKWITIFTMAICFIFSIVTPFVDSLPSVLCAIVARFAVNISYAVTMQWAAEMLPTSVRGSGTSVVQICGYIATVISPYIVYLKVYIPGLPLIIVGIVAAIGAVTAMFLPETAGKNMPDTFGEAENLIHEQKFFDIPFLRKTEQLQTQ